jgi:hypothetical protein
MYGISLSLDYVIDLVFQNVGMRYLIIGPECIWDPSKGKILLDGN